MQVESLIWFHFSNFTGFQNSGELYTYNFTYKYQLEAWLNMTVLHKGKSGSVWTIITTSKDDHVKDSWLDKLRHYSSCLSSFMYWMQLNLITKLI